MMDNSCWLLGDGRSIKFWKDAWCGAPFISFTVESDILDDNVLVSDFIHENKWSLPQFFFEDFPELWNLVHKEVIPLPYPLKRMN
jgi:hypothetical protein